MTSCPERQILHRFAAGTASGCERRQVVRHLLARCGPCAALLRSVFRPEIEGDYDAALTRWTTARARARELVEVGGR